MRATGAILLCLAAPALAEVEGAVRLTGSTATAHFARAWGPAFQRAHPKAPVQVVATSSGAAPKAMQAGPGTLGMMSRPMTQAEREGLARRGKPPLELKVALDAVGIYVRKDNPALAISLTQLEQAFSARPREGGRAGTWGELGYGGALAAQPIAAFGFERGRGAYEVMRELALGGGDFHAGVSQEPVSSSVVQGVGVEPGGIGYASVYFKTPRTRLLAVARPGRQPVAPTEEAIMTGHYPLSRYLYLYAHADATPAARAFLAFVLSEDGQALVRGAGGIPIPAQLAAGQRALLRSP